MIIVAEQFFYYEWSQTARERTMKEGVVKAIITIILLCGSTLMDRYAEAQVGCSAQEQQLYNSYIQQYFLAANQRNLQAMIMLNKELLNDLSPACLEAIEKAQANMPHPSYPVTPPQMPPSIYDHGDHTYSVPGGVTCGPGGCLSD